MVKMGKISTESVNVMLSAVSVTSSAAVTSLLLRSSHIPTQMHRSVVVAVVYLHLQAVSLTVVDSAARFHRCART